MKKEELSKISKGMCGQERFVMPQALLRSP